MAAASSLFTSPLSFLFFFFFPIVLLFFFFHSSSDHRPSRAKSPPCPQSYPVIGNLIGFLRNRHRFHDWVAEMLSETPNSTLRVKTFLNLSHGICTVDPANLQHLLAVNFPNYIKGSRYHDVLRELLGDGIFAVDGHLWAAQRKVASYEFSTRSLKHFIADTVNFEITHRLIPFLSEACDENRVIDLQQVLQKFTFDNICNVAFGVDPHSLNMRSSSASNLPNASAFVSAFEDAIGIVSSRFMSPLPLIWKVKRSLNIGSERRFKDDIDVIDQFALSIIRSKEEAMEMNPEKGNEAASNQDLLSRFMSSSSHLEFDNPEQRRKFLRDIVISFMLAGKDSTSTALTWFFWLVAGHHRSESRILAELSSPEKKKTGGIFTYDELKKLHYVHAAVSESMRLFPPVPIDSRLTVDEDVLPDGTYVGKGWFADYSAYAMGRNRKVWGDDCREFKPERWLDDAGAYRPQDQFRYPVFHSGPRMCLGKEMAYVQMKSIVAAVMGEFEVLPIDGGGTAEKMMNPLYTWSLLLKMRGGLPVRLKRRSLI
ncbi:cytochrome P450 94A1-like [Punica granatum]|uniref:Uncharacterized protein n=2 Tax=Punica granatum TaxID=22663 RepID=A0A218WAN9_PUNGR|nr:cytochrome P450 94A1-like [Punica granatum]OWM69152.1 hypothetical protein CDL15_Pgr025339 [Punica granatum]PKI57750.1 hypothetical protein CRG98_021817 [Punica granatum]